MPHPPKVLAFAASNSAHSINKRLALHAADVLTSISDPAPQIDTLDLNDFDMPVYSPERETLGIPPQAHAFYDKLGAADGLIISLAEYNGSFTAAFKNVFDWASRIKMQIFQDKPVFLLATSIGGRGGQNVMNAALGGFPHFGATVTSNFSFGPFSEHFAQSGLKTPALQDDLKQAVTAFASHLPK